jgi:hypothetical protein
MMCLNSLVMWQTKNSIKKQEAKLTISDFYNDISKAIEELKAYEHSNNVVVINNDLIQKAERLKRIGIKESKEIELANAEIQKLENNKKINEASRDLREAINYFGSKYQNYKFITEGSLNAVLNKYNFSILPISKFKECLSEETISIIENISIDEKDYAYKLKLMGEHGRVFVPREYGYSSREIPSFFSKSDAAEWALNNTLNHTKLEPVKSEFYFVYHTDSSELKLDKPLILCPVMYLTKLHFLIIKDIPCTK